MKGLAQWTGKALALAMTCTVAQGSQAIFLEEQGTLGMDSSFSEIGMNPYSRELAMSDDGFITVKDVESEFWGITDMKGNEILDYKYDDLDYLMASYFYAREGDNNFLLSVTPGTVGSGVILNVGEFDSVTLVNGYLKVTPLADDAHIYYDTNLNVVGEATALDGWDQTVKTCEIAIKSSGGAHYIQTHGGIKLVGPSTTAIHNTTWNGIMYNLTAARFELKSNGNYDGTVLPFHITQNGTVSTFFVDYTTGEVIADFPYKMSNINENGYFIYETADGSLDFGRTDQAIWLEETLPNTTQGTLTNPIHSDWALPFIKLAREEGLLLDSLGTNYSKDITREQIAESLVNLVEIYTETTLDVGEISFQDTENTAILKGAEAGMVSGRGDGTFDPQASASRQEISVMVYRAILLLEDLFQRDLVEKDSELKGFHDVNSVESWALDAMGILVNNGIMTGTSMDTLSPQSNTTIEQCIALMTAVNTK